MNRIGPLIALFLLAGVARGECENPSLVVDEHAEGVKFRDCWQVEYVVQEPYPAGGLIRRVTDALVGQGWQKLDFDPIDPAAPEHVVHGWSVHRATDQAETRVDQWLGWFIREDESRVQVTFRYLGRAPDDHSRQPTLATVTFVPPEQWEKRPK